MGIETIAFLALSAVSASMKMNDAKKQAEGVAREGELVAKEKAKEVRYKVARQTSSFLNSGLTLEGTPQDVIGETFSTGKEDIGNIQSNYNAKSKNIISSARTEAIGQIAGSFAGASLGGSAGSMFGATSAGVQSAYNGTGFGTGYDVYKSVNNPSNRGFF